MGGASTPRLAAFLLGLALAAGAWALTGRGAALALLPMTLAALWLFPPTPWAGWAAAGCALAGRGLAVASLRTVQIRASDTATVMSAPA